MSAFHNNMLLGSAKTADLGDPIEQSLRFRGAQYLQNTNTLGNGTWTWSFWAKWSVDKLANSRQALVSTGDASTRGYLTFYNYGTDATYPSNRSLVSYSSSGTAYGIPGTLSGGYTDQKFADPSAWYHFVLVNKSSPDGCELWVNGVLQSDCNNPNNGWGFFGDDILIGGTLASSYYYSGYQADHYFIDGQALPPETFGRYNADGVWVPKTPTISSYGSNGFHLTFDSSQTNGIGHDSSGQGNHFSATGFDLTSGDADYDLMQDSPTQNWSTLNPLQPGNLTAMYDGNLEQWLAVTLTSGTTTTIELPEDDVCYWEVTVSDAGTTPDTSSGYWFFMLGLFPDVQSVDLQDYKSWYGTECFGLNFHSVSYTNFGIVDSGNINHDGTFFTGASPLNSVYGILVDRPNNRIKVFRNGVEWAPTDTSSTIVNGWLTLNYSGDSSWAIGVKNYANDVTYNFGQQPFQYTPPTGYKALQTQNLAEPTIKDPSEHFRAIADTGANILTTAQAAFSTGLWWIKDRVNINQHQLVDSVNGTSDVFQSPAGTTGNTYAAPSGDSVAWCWNAENTNGGFSITNGTHGLGVTPAMVIDRAGNVFHESLTAGQGLVLTSSAAVAAQTWTVNSTTVSGPGSGTYYAWSEIPGYSAFGTYTGNGVADGPFIYTGFKPAFVMTKINASGDWQIRDNARSPYNPAINTLYPNATNTEYTGAQADVDLLSNGFKIRNTDINASSSTYIYAAFAEQPFGGENTPPATAR
jgi:hypothetical protein